MGVFMVVLLSDLGLLWFGANGFQVGCLYLRRKLGGLLGSCEGI